MRATAVLVCLTLWGCGDDGGNNHPPDAPRGSGDDGGAPDTATPQPVTITVTDGPNPVANVPVYFQAADYSLVAMKMTDASGIASQVMDAGGYVTAVDAYYNRPIERRSRRPGRPYGHDLHTFAGVKPGDHLMLPRADFTSTSIDVTLPVFAGALSYSLHYTGSDPDPLYDAPAFVEGAGSGSGSPMATVDVYGNHAVADFLVYAEDDEDGQFAFVPNQSTAAAIDLSAATYTAITDVSFAVSGLPNDVTLLYGINYLVSAHGLIWQDQRDNEVATNATTLTLHRPTPAATSILQLDVTDASELANSYLVDWKPAAAATTIDATNRRLKAYATSPAFDQATHAATWTEATTGADGDASIVKMSGYRETASMRWDWEMVAAHGATGAVFPVLPTGLDQYNAQADDSLSMDSVRVVKAAGGYDALRSVALGGSLATFVTSATGQLAYSQWPWVNPTPTIQPVGPLGPVGQFLKNSLRAVLH